MKHRIVSLLASATETTWALGFGEALVGRSHECDYPEEVKRLPQCSRPKLNPEAASKDIHAQVIDLLGKALSIYRVDADLIRSLEPTVILTQDHCRVCAVSLGDVEEAACAFFPSHPRIVSLSPDDFSGVMDGIADIASALGAPERGAAMVARMWSKVDAVSLRTGSENKPRVAYLEWLNPLMAGGNWMPELVQWAGGQNLFGQAGKHSPWMKFAELGKSDPDIILLAPCGFDIPRTREEARVLRATAGWEDLRAVRKDRVYVMDGNRFFNRPGPRLEQSLEILAEIFHPDLFHFGHQGDGWEKL